MFKKTQGDIADVFFSSLLLVILVLLFYAFFERAPTQIKLREPFYQSSLFIFPFFEYHFTLTLGNTVTTPLTFVQFGYLLFKSKQKIRDEIIQGLTKEIDSLQMPGQTPGIPYFCVEYKLNNQKYLVPINCQTAAYLVTKFKFKISDEDTLDVNLYYDANFRYYKSIYQYIVNSKNTNLE